MMHGNFISQAQQHHPITPFKWKNASQSTTQSPHISLDEFEKCFLGKNDSWIWISKSNQQNIYGLTFFLRCNILWLVSSVTHREMKKLFLYFFNFQEKRAEPSPLPTQPPRTDIFMEEIYVFLFSQNVFIVFWWNNGSNGRMSSSFCRFKDIPVIGKTSIKLIK